MMRNWRWPIVSLPAARIADVDALRLPGGRLNFLAANPSGNKASPTTHYVGSMPLTDNQVDEFKGRAPQVEFDETGVIEGRLGRHVNAKGIKVAR